MMKGQLTKITDYNAKELDVYVRLNEGQLLNRANLEEGLFIAESPMVINTAIDAGYQPVSVLIEEKEWDQASLKVLEKCGDIPIYTAPFEVLTQITGFKLTRGMLCAMRRPLLSTVQQVIKDAKRLVILENVMNPTNVGAIFRSAAALNMDGILLTKGCSNPYYRRSIRVSMGTVFQIPWTFFDEKICWPLAGMELLKNNGFKTIAMALTEHSVSIHDPALLREEKLAIILGTEGTGLLDETIAACDYTVKIPMSHGVDSLNVAAASAIAFWELGK